LSVQPKILIHDYYAVTILGYEMETTISGSGSSGKVLLKKVLLICGILSSLLYVGTDILGGMLWEGYSFTSQPISALSAIGAPTRPLVVPLYLAYEVLVIAFGLGVWGSAGRNRALRVTGGLLIGIGLIGSAWTPFPMHLGEPVSSLANTMHSIFAGVQVLFILLTMGFGAVAYRKRFRFYSIGTLLTLLVAGVVSFWLVAAGQPTTWFGVIERINVYGYLLWVAVLAVVLLRAEKGQVKILSRTLDSSRSL
jgi:hypothetical protein